jgi:serine acetyltransferase
MDKIIFLPSKDIFFNFFYKRLDSINITKEELEVLIGKNCKQLFDVIYNRFKLFKSEYYNKDNNVQIITGHYCQFFFILYELSKILYDKDREDLANVIYFLNTTQISCDVSFKINLPLRTYIDHPFGSVIGHVKFNKDKIFLFTTNCTLGGNFQKNGEFKYPKIDGDLVMLSNSSLVGNNIIKGQVLLSNGCYVKDEGIIKDVVVFGRSPNLILKPIPDKVKPYFEKFNN